MKKSEKILAFIALAIASFLTVLDSTIVNVSLPTMAQYFKTDISGISWVTTAYLIPFSALLINFSKISDIFGRKKLFLIGLFLFGAASICCGLSTSLSMIIVFRIIQGVGAAILTPLSIPLGIELFGKAALGKLAIIVGMIISISAASGPVVGGILNEAFGFKAIFYVNIPFVIIALILGGKYIRECYDNTIEKKIDFIGSILLAYGLGALTFFLVKGNDYGWTKNSMLALIFTSIISIVVFLLYEKNIKNPMIEFKLFKLRSFTASIMIIAIIFFAYMPVSYLMNFYLENQLNYSVLKSGLIIGIVSIVSFVMSPLYSFLAKKTSTKVTSLIAVVFVSAGNIMFVFMNSTNNVSLIYAAFIVFGLGLGATTPLYQSAFEEVSIDKNGIASGILNSLRQLAACIAIALVATLSTHYTSVAIDNSKNEIINVVNSDNILNSDFKNSINNSISKSTSSSNSSFSKANIKELISEKEDFVLSRTPDKAKAIVKNEFSKQETEVLSIIDKANKIKTDETNKVYNKCFLFFGVIAMLGILIVPFNSKKEMEKSENVAQVGINN